MIVKPTDQPPRPYHHGDLRTGLIDAAAGLLRDSGTWAFTLREVARAAGVSHNAPYNHFKDKRALLAGVAEVGFAQLKKDLEAGLSDDAPNHIARISVLAVAYVGFARANPAMFRLMFSEELANATDLPGLQQATFAAFDILRSSIVAAAADRVLSPDPDGKTALGAWALVHGLATLMMDRRVPLPDDKDAIDALVAGLAGDFLAGVSRRATEAGS